MGYIDSDSHVFECDATWDFFDPDERHLKPLIEDGYWAFEDVHTRWPRPHQLKWMREYYPHGAVDLSDPAARIRCMDEMGVDVHILFPSFWLGHDTANPLREAAMARSYNRWIANKTADSGGRLLWMAHAPIRTMERSFEELEFARNNGAAGVFLRGITHGMGITDPYLCPLYERAQDLDLTIGVHVGANENDLLRRDGRRFFHSFIMPVPGAVHDLLTSDFSERFPRLRWSFVEAGAGWLPWVLQERYRADEEGIYREEFNDWRSVAKEAFAAHQLFVSCLMDDDIPYLVDLAGPERLTQGTDFGHVDVGTDPNALHIVANRPDLDPLVARNIVDSNARRAYGIDFDFQPAPAPTREGPYLSANALGA